MRFEKDAKEAVDRMIYDYEHFDAEDYHQRARALAESISENSEEYEISYDGYTPTYDIRDLSRDGVEIKLVNEKYGYGEDDKTAPYHEVWVQIYRCFILRQQRFGRIYRFVYRKA